MIKFVVHGLFVSCFMNSTCTGTHSTGRSVMLIENAEKFVLPQIFTTLNPSQAIE